MAAASQNHLGTLELLIAHGADVSAADRAELTALDHAQRKCHHKCVEFLAKHAERRFHEVQPGEQRGDSSEEKVVTSPEIRQLREKLERGTAAYASCFCDVDDRRIQKQLSLLPFKFYPNEGPRHGLWRYTPERVAGCQSEQEALEFAGHPLLIELVAELCRLLEMQLRRVWVLRYPDGASYIGPHSDALTEEENMGATISFGAPRALRWQSNQGAAYTRETMMRNGDVVCFTQGVNASFQHSVLATEEDSRGQPGERIVVVVWGWRCSPGAPFPRELPPPRCRERG